MNPRIEPRIGASAKRYQRVEIISVCDFLEEIYRRKNRRNELYGLLPRQPLR